MSRITLPRYSRCIVASLILSWVGSVSCCSLEAKQSPDVLFFIVDDLNDWNELLDATSAIKTPNLMRIADRGMLFTRAYCASPACNPSRVATLTGLRPTTTGVYGNRSDWRGALPKRKTLMEHFRTSGYTVRGAGKIFHHHLQGAFHDPDSFDHFQPMRAQLYPMQKLGSTPDYGSKNTDWGIWPEREELSIDFATADYCVKQLRKLKPDDPPLFLACGIFKPHSPFFAPREYHQPYSSLSPPHRNPDDWDDLPEGAATLMARQRWFWKGMMGVENERPGAYNSFIRSYAACVTFADAQIGRVLDALEASQRNKDTVIVLWSDHGFHLGEKDHIEKFALWEKSNHVPYLIVAPGVTRPGSKCEHPVDLMSLYPTLLELCGIEADDQCDGISLVPLLSDPRAPWETPALMTYQKGNHAIRTQRWRYIRYADGTEELYDHDADPMEWSNLATLPGYEQVLKRHRVYLPKAEAAPVVDRRSF